MKSAIEMLSSFLETLWHQGIMFWQFFILVSSNTGNSHSSFELAFVFDFSIGNQSP
jgi:hypothetical protein